MNALEGRWALVSCMAPVTTDECAKRGKDDCMGAELMNGRNEIAIRNEQKNEKRRKWGQQCRHAHRYG
jgi:hypothetical protein